MSTAQITAWIASLLSLRTQLKRELPEPIAPISPVQEQKLVNDHFHRAAQYWRDIYNHTDVYAYIHQRRGAITLDWVDSIGLPRQARVLDIGCGTGLTSIALAKRQLRVDAIDAVPAMIESTRKEADRAGVGDCVQAALGDCHQLRFADNTFSAVVALGVTPFLHSLPQAIAEIQRVLKPGGTLIINADNRWRLPRLFDPAMNPVVQPLRSGVRRLLVAAGLRRPTQTKFIVHMYSRREFEQVILENGFEILRQSMLGFGPFTVFGRSVLPNRLGLRLHATLQRLADGNWPLLRTTGAQYMLMARKPVRV